jgi:hypothetical protein
MSDISMGNKNKNNNNVSNARISKRALSIGLAAVLVLSSIVVALPVKAQAAPTITTSVDAFGGKLFGPSLVRVLINDPAKVGTPTDQVTVTVEAKGTTVQVPVNEIGTSGQFELYIAVHTTAFPRNPTNPGELTNNNSDGYTIVRIHTANLVVNDDNPLPDVNGDNAADHDPIQRNLATGANNPLTSGDKIKISYTGAQDKELTFEPRTASLSVDRDLAGNGDRIILRLNDPDANIDPTAVDAFAVNNNPNTGNITSPALNINVGGAIWQETGANTGVFELVVIATSANVNDPNGGDNIVLLPQQQFPSNTTFTIRDHDVYAAYANAQTPYNTIQPTNSTAQQSVSLRNSNGKIELAAPLTIANGFQIKVTDPDRNIDTTSRDNINSNANLNTTTPASNVTANNNTNPNANDDNVAYQVTGLNVTTTAATSGTITIRTRLTFDQAPAGTLSAAVNIAVTGQGLTLGTPSAIVTGTGNTRTVTVTIPFSTVTDIANVALGNVTVTVSGITNAVTLQQVSNPDDNTAGQSAAAIARNQISINNVGLPITFRETGDNTGIFLPDLANNKIEIVPVANLPAGTDIANGIRLGNDNKIYVTAAAIRNDTTLTITYTDPAWDPNIVRSVSIQAKIGHVAGNISTTTQTIPVTGKIIFQITDNDLNVNPLGKDFYTVVFNTANSANEDNSAELRGLADLRIKVNGSGVNFAANNLSVPIEETDVNSGVFTGEIRVSAINNVLGLRDGDRITIEYIDNTEDPIITRSVDVNIGRPAGRVELDRSSYPPTPVAPEPAVGQTRLHITITDLSENRTSSSQDQLQLIGRLRIDLIRNNAVFATINPGTPVIFPDTTASETDVNTGVFTVDVNLPGQLAGQRIGDGVQIQVVYRDSDGNDQTATAIVATNTAQITTDKPTYDLGETITLRIVEPDWNFDSDKIDEINLAVLGADFVVNSDRVSDMQLANLPNQPPNGANVPLDPSTTLRETGKNTGIFEIKLKEINSNLVSRGKNLEFTYNDRTTSGGGVNIEVKHTVLIAPTTADIIFDKETYTPFDRVLVTIVDSAANVRPDVKDTLGGNARVRIIVGGSSQDVTAQFEETAVNSGVFKPRPPNDNGFLIQGINNRVVPGDGIRVEYRSPDRQTEITKSVPIVFSNGTISLDKDSYKPNETVVITINDPDENRNPDIPDQFEVKVVSTTDPTGIKVSVRETGDRTGVFKGEVILTTGLLSSGNRLQVREGDIITVTYTDETLPNAQTLVTQLVNRNQQGLRTLQTLDVQASAIVGVLLAPTERTAVAKPSLRDQAGNVLTQASVDVPVSIASSIKNNTQQPQKFVYIVQVKDADGFVVSISTVGGTLPAGQSFDVSASWTPTAAGTYTIEVFVWNELGKPSPLSKVESATVRAV